MKLRLLAILLCLLLLLSGCGQTANTEETTTQKETITTNSPVTQDTSGKTPDTAPPVTDGKDTQQTVTTQTPVTQTPTTQAKPNTPETSPSQGDVADLGDGNTTFGDDIKDSGAYDGYFETESKDVVITCLSGTQNAYKLEGNTLTFTAVSENSIYSLSGKFSGNIVIDTGDSYKFDLELHGLSLVSTSANPITVKTGDKVTIKAKKDTKNYIYDNRPAIDSADETLYSGAIHSEVDLEISGKGELTVISEKNNGIHSKDDLEVKNLTLYIACIDNSLKGNDSVVIENANTTLIAAGGDCIKTSSSDISTKGAQRGSISISGGTHNLYAACDGIDAAYNVTIDDSTTTLNIYTDKYSNYSKEVTATTSDINYIRYTSSKYYYSVKYYNSDTDYVWVNAESHSTVNSGRTKYYYYSYPTKANYQKIQFFVYESASQQGQESTYYAKTDYLTPNSGYDTFALTISNSKLSYQWTNYTTQSQPGGFPGGMGGGMGPGGMQDGNSDKGNHSTKGIKAANEIIINAGTINIKSYDDAIHANNDTTLENGAKPIGNVTVNGGTITVYSNDDGLHADGTLFIKGGTVSVINAYEGLEGTKVSISGGYISVNSKDDGINATTTSGTAIEISGGVIYIYCTGDGIDSNSKTADVGIVFTGGKTVVISNSSMNSSLDTENGYTYTAGSVVAIMPHGGMSNEATHCDNFNSIGKSSQVTLNSGSYLVVKIGSETATIQNPVSLSALVVVLGDKSASITTENSTSQTLDSNGVAWN